MQLVRGVFAVCFAWAFTVAYWSLFIIFSILTWRRFSYPVIAPLAHVWGRALLFVAGIKVIPMDLEQLQSREARLVFINHQSALDIIIGASLMPPASFAIGKRELGFIPFFNILWWSARCAFIDRANRAKAIATLNRVIETIKAERCSLWIAPEGTRTRTGELLPFKKGPFHIAIQSKLPLYVVVLDGAFQSLPKGKNFPKSGIVRIKCLPPIDTSNWSTETLEQHLNEVRGMMAETLRELQQR